MLQICQQRLGAMVPRADRYAVARKNFADIMGMHAVYREGDDAAVLLGILRAEHMDAGTTA